MKVKFISLACATTMLTMHVFAAEPMESLGIPTTSLSVKSGSPLSYDGQESGEKGAGSPLSYDGQKKGARSPLEEKSTPEKKNRPSFLSYGYSHKPQKPIDFTQKGKENGKPYNPCLLKIQKPVNPVNIELQKINQGLTEENETLKYQGMKDQKKIQELEAEIEYLAYLKTVLGSRDAELEGCRNYIKRLCAKNGNLKNKYTNLKSRNGKFIQAYPEKGSKKKKLKKSQVFWSDKSGFSHNRAVKSALDPVSSTGQD